MSREPHFNYPIPNPHSRHPCEGKGPAFFISYASRSWIPAFAGMTELEGTVTLAKARVQLWPQERLEKSWIPAFAGMTELEGTVTLAKARGLLNH